MRYIPELSPWRTLPYPPPSSPWQLDAEVLLLAIWHVVTVQSARLFTDARKLAAMVSRPRPGISSPNHSPDERVLELSSASFPSSSLTTEFSVRRVPRESFQRTIKACSLFYDLWSRQTRTWCLLQLVDGGWPPRLLAAIWTEQRTSGRSQGTENEQGMKTSNVQFYLNFVIVFSERRWLLIFWYNNWLLSLNFHLWKESNSRNISKIFQWPFLNEIVLYSFLTNLPVVVRIFISLPLCILCIHAVIYDLLRKIDIIRTCLILYRQTFQVFLPTLKTAFL